MQYLVNASKCTSCVNFFFLAEQNLVIFSSFSKIKKCKSLRKREKEKKIWTLATLNYCLIIRKKHSYCWKTKHPYNMYAIHTISRSPPSVQHLIKCILVITFTGKTGVGEVFVLIFKNNKFHKNFIYNFI